MGIFSTSGKPPIERILDEAMPMVLGLHHAVEEDVWKAGSNVDETRAAIEAYVAEDGVLLDPAALEQGCTLAALMTGAVAAISPTVLCIDLAPAGEGTELRVRVHCKQGLLARDTGKRALEALRKALEQGAIL